MNTIIRFLKLTCNTCTWTATPHCIHSPIWNPFFTIAAKGLQLTEGSVWLTKVVIGTPSVDRGSVIMLEGTQAYNPIPLVNRRVCSVSRSRPQHTLGWPRIPSAANPKSTTFLWVRSLRLTEHPSSIRWWVFGWPKASVTIPESTFHLLS